MHDGFLKWCDGHPSEAESALRSLWNSQDGIEEAVSEFLERIPDDALRGKGTRVSLASFLATAIDPYKYPVYRITVFDDGYRLSGHPQPAAGADEAETYRHALSFLDTLVKEASSRGLELRDRLDAQSVLWSVVRSGVYEDVLPEVEHAIFLRYRKSDELPPLTFEGTVADQVYSQNHAITALSLPAASGGNGALAFALAPTLPAGLTIDPSAHTLKRDADGGAGGHDLHLHGDGRT